MIVYVFVSGGTFRLGQSDVFCFSGPVMRQVLWGTSQGEKANEYKHAIIYVVGQKVVWKLGQKSEYKSSENWASNRGKWGKLRHKVLSNRPNNAALCRCCP